MENKGRFKKGHTPWLKGIKGLVKPNKGSFQKGKHYSPKTEFLKGQNLGSQHPLWKGDKVGYAALHNWIYRQKGNAIKCENKDCKYPRKNAAYQILRAPKRFYWANISHKYKRDLSDWIQLCGSCHKKYDMGLIKLNCD